MPSTKKRPFVIRMEADETKSNQPGKIRPQRVFENVIDVEQEMANTKAHAQTFYTQAEAEGRGVREDELAVVEQHLEYWDWLKEKELPRMQKFETMRREEAQKNLQERAGPALSRAKALTSTMGGFHNPPRSPKVLNTNMQAYRADMFDGGAGEAEQAAVDAGHWLRAVLCNSRKSAEYCKQHEHLRLDRFDESFDAQTVDDDTKGGYLVPDVIGRTVIDLRNRWGLISRIARRYPMSSETDLVPKRAAGLTVYKPGEDVGITPSEKTYGQVSLTCKDAYTLTYISHKLMRGSVVNAADQVVSEIAHAFAKGMDYEGIQGDGTAGTPDWEITGAVVGLTGTGTAGISPTNPANWAAITSAMVSELIGLLPDRYHENARFVCSRSFWAQVLEPLLEAHGGSKSDMASTTQRAYRGYPVEFTEHMPTATGTSQMCLLFGSFYDGFLFGDREQIGIASSEHEKFSIDQLAIRGRTAYDLKFHDPGDGSLPGAIVGLQTSA